VLLSATTMKQQSSEQRRDPVLLQVRTIRGTAARIARAVGISRTAVWNWRHVPADHVLDIEKLLGIPRHLIRPDIYEPPYHPRTKKWLSGGGKGRGQNGETRGREEHL
jgi:hypothetical protein